MSSTLTAVFLAVIFFAGFTQGLTGFGSILISVSILAMVMDLQLIIPLVSLFALCINLALFVRLWSKVHWRTEAVMLASTVPGIPLGVYALSRFPSAALEIVLGLVLVGFNIWFLTARPTPKRPRKTWAGLAGFSAGILGGSIGANGPPIILFTAVQPWTKTEIKATMVAYFLLGGFGISGMHWQAGLITPEVLEYFVLGIPVLLAGVLAGAACFGKIPEAVYKKGISVFLIVLGLNMLGRHTLWG